MASGAGDEATQMRPPIDDRYPGVQFGPGCTIGEHALIGVMPQGGGPDIRTSIGARACIRSHTVIYAGSTIGADFQTGHGALLREFNVVGDNVSVGSHSVVEHHVRLGDGVRIHSGAFVPEYTEIRAGAWIGPQVTLTNALYPLSPDVKERLRGPLIHEGAKIGAGATILPGLEVGADALVGAGAVVVEDVAPGSVVVGNPARAIKRIQDIPAYALHVPPQEGGL